MESRLKKFGEFEGARNEAAQNVPAVSWKTLEDGREILGVEWRDAVGIVATHNKVMDYWIAYMGVAKENGDEKSDTLRIANHGTKLSETEARAFFPHINNIKYKKAD